MKKKTGKVIKLETVRNNLPIKQEKNSPLNEKCKEIVKNTIVPLFEDKNLSEFSNLQVLYAFSFYLTQEQNQYLNDNIDTITINNRFNSYQESQYKKRSITSAIIKK